MAPCRSREVVVGVVALVLVTSALACGDGGHPVAPENRRPVVLSLSAFPADIGMSDSALITCEATDPDGDTLVYDWITDGRLSIQGASPGGSSLYNTSGHTRVVYPARITAPVETVWVQCFARDRRGKSDNGVVLFLVRQ